MRAVVVVLLLLTVPGSVLACLWDHDTIAVERRRFPSILELITGKFLRHSTEYYEWRIGDRSKRIMAEPENAALYDDLAVAYDKTGRQDLAIETILKVETFSPGRYETQANLGTFHIHAGQFEQGLQHIEKAIEINPEAHFGREVYQKLLVEYVLWKSAGDSQLSLHPDHQFWTQEFQIRGFAWFVVHKQGLLKDEDTEYPKLADQDEAVAELKRAIKGVSGMMRFGHHDSPILLDALADLLRSTGYDDDAKLLASRALLQASYNSNDEKSRRWYAGRAEEMVFFQTPDGRGDDGITVEELDRRFQVELKDAEAWYEQIRRDELKWIAEGKDVDAEFADKYYNVPAVNAEKRWSSRITPQRVGLITFAVAISLIAILIVLRRKPAPTSQTPQ